MCIGWGESYDIASPEKATELGLAGGTAGLRDDWCGGDRNEPSLKPGAMLSPYGAIATICGNQYAGVVDRAHAERLRGAESSSATRWRAAIVSSAVNAPFARSHSATAASPSRTTSARRAASVIQADTLTPSAAAASTSRSWTSGSTVMASFGEGFPRGIPNYTTAVVGLQQPH
jgi:hypothetical protein